MRREMYFKTSMGRKAIQLMLSETLEKLEYKNSGKAKWIFFSMKKI